MDHTASRSRRSSASCGGSVVAQRLAWCVYGGQRPRVVEVVPGPVSSPAAAREADDPVAADALVRESRREQWLASRPGWTEAGWWDAALQPDVRALLWLPKGAKLMAAVQAVPAVDGSACPFPHADAVAPGHLLPATGTAGDPCACQVITIAAWAAAAAWAADRADDVVLRGLGVFPQREPVSDVRPQWGEVVDPNADTVACALRRSPASMTNLLAKLRDRAQTCPEFQELIDAGHVAAWMADLLVDDVQHLDAEKQDAVLAAVAAKLRQRHQRGFVGWTFSEIRSYARTVMAKDVDELAKRRKAAKESRDVTLTDFGAGQSRIGIDLPTDLAHRVYHRVNALAHGLATGDGRTIGQRRADIAVDLLLATPSTDSDTGSSGTAGMAGTAGAAGAVLAPSGTSGREIAVVVSLAALLGATDDAAVLPTGEPVPADVARELASDARWRAWLTDATGVVVATSPTTYTPTTAVARVVHAREPVCRFPGCQRRRTDRDHINPWPTGPTIPGNLAAVCRRHHNHKTHRRWTLVTNTADPPDPDDPGPPEPDTWTWTDPTGITHTDTYQPALPADG